MLQRIVRSGLLLPLLLVGLVSMVAVVYVLANSGDSPVIWYGADSDNVSGETDVLQASASGSTRLRSVYSTNVDTAVARHGPQ